MYREIFFFVFQSVKGGRDFTYRTGCIEHLCDCYCNGTHYCDPEKEVDFCKLDRDRAKNTQPKGNGQF